VDPFAQLNSSREGSATAGGGQLGAWLEAVGLGPGLAQAVGLWDDWKYTVYVFLPGALLMWLYFKVSYVEEAL
jgi:hypothetical protein